MLQPLKWLKIVFSLLLCVIHNHVMAIDKTASIRINSHVLTVEVADTLTTLRDGLMYRSFLPVDKGMLFVFPHLVKPRFWMKNTYISLDMLFIDDTNKIVWIYRNAQPQSQAMICCPYRVRAVLEINGGAAQQMNIKVGDYVQPINQNDDL